MDDIHLPATERAKRYRELAADARREAAETTRGSAKIVPDHRRPFDHLALLADAEIMPDHGQRTLWMQQAAVALLARPAGAPRWGHYEFRDQAFLCFECIGNYLVDAPE